MTFKKIGFSAPSKMGCTIWLFTLEPQLHTTTTTTTYILPSLGSVTTGRGAQSREITSLQHTNITIY
jgi:hypothetical protein